MANKCSDYLVKGCPASCYLKCPALRDGKNCWEVLNVPCCPKSSLDACRRCEVFKRASAMEAEGRYR